MPVHRRHALQSPFNDLYTAMQRDTAGTDVAMTPGFRFDAVFDPMAEIDGVMQGEVRYEDVFRFFPVVYTLANGEVTGGARLREILEEELTLVFSPDAWMQGGGWMPGFSGIDAHVDLTRPDGDRVVSLATFDGTPIAGSDTLSITGCRRPFDADDVLCSHGGFSNITDLTDPSSGDPLSPVDLFIGGLQRGDVDVATSVIDDAATPMWPQAPFVQPLTGVMP